MFNLRRIFKKRKTNNVNTVNTSLRNDSGQYIIILNGKYICECQVIERIETSSFSQKITTEFKLTKILKKEISVREIALIDKIYNSHVGFRTLPYDLLMSKGDILTISWFLNYGKGLVSV